MNKTQHKTAEQWAKVIPAAVVAGSTAQAENVLQMAIDDIAAMGAEIARLRGLLSVADTQIVGLYSAATPGGNYASGNRFADNDPVVKEIRAVLSPIPDHAGGMPVEVDTLDAKDRINSSIIANGGEA